MDTEDLEGLKTVEKASALAATEELSDDDSLPYEDPDDTGSEDEEHLDSLLTLVSRTTPLRDLESVSHDNIHYVWTPLNAASEIRLMVLYPSKNFEDPIEFRMEVVKMEQTGRYEALSYCWGPQFSDGSHLSHLIYCYFGHADERNTRFLRPLKITLTLHAALKRLRQRAVGGPALRLWVDAICINQTNNAERRAQVRIMGWIYSYAYLTTIWLGESLFESEPALLQELARLSDRDAVQRTTFRDPQALQNLFNNTWFRRRWTLQEYLLATGRQFLAGSVQFSPSPVLDIAERFKLPFPPLLAKAHQMSCHLPSPLAERDHPAQISRVSDTTLLDSLIAYRETKCTAEHDLIFALIGFSTDGHCVKLDYDQTVDSLFEEVARMHMRISESSNWQLLQQNLARHEQVTESGFLARTRANTTERYSKALEVLIWAACSSGGRSKRRLPSWVPDWTNIPQDTQLETSAMNALAAFRNWSSLCTSAGRLGDPQSRKNEKYLRLPRCKGIIGSVLRIETLLIDHRGLVIVLGDSPPASQDYMPSPGQRRAIARNLHSPQCAAWLPRHGLAWVLEPAPGQPALHFRLVSNIDLRNVQVGDWFAKAWGKLWPSIAVTIHLL